ncbi:MAG: AraC family transcriptional regulator [Ruminococcaceae bacterium]|nr:AraC family transcriptional regulator [Oscillospiraceae bacterium]
MIAESSKFFEDKNFPLCITPNRTSVIDKIEDGKCSIHEAIEIKYFYEGRSTLLIGNEAVVANAGDVIVMNPYEFHATISCSEEKGKYHLIMVGLDFFDTMTDMGKDLRTIFFREKKGFINKIENSDELRYLLSAVIRENTERSEAYKLRLRGLMTEVIALLMRNGMRSTENLGSEQRVRYHTTIEPALRKIRNEYHRSLTLELLAEECCVNKYYFCRIFKEAMGISPMQYLSDYRLNNADILLRNTEKGISEIISDCGFNDESYFYRCYKKHFGVTPYSRRNQKEI